MIVCGHVDTNRAWESLKQYTQNIVNHFACKKLTMKRYSTQIFLISNYRTKTMPYDLSDAINPYRSCERELQWFSNYYDLDIHISCGGGFKIGGKTLLFTHKQNIFYMRQGRWAVKLNLILCTKWAHTEPYIECC